MKSSVFALWTLAGLAGCSMGGQSRTGAPGGEPRAAQVSIVVPARADGAYEVADTRSPVRVRVSLVGAAAVPFAGTTAAGAAPSAGDVSHAVSPVGLEDFVAYRRAPAEERLAYRVDVRAVAGLRLVENTLELLDAGGAPRLRVLPPYVMTPAGRLPATLTVEGCPVDRSPAAPWGRPPVAPGRESCTVVVSWAGRGAAYPLVVDPAWVGTSAMTTPRRFAAVALLPNPVAAPGEAARVLVTGGFNAAGTALSSAEIYEPLSRTFAVTGAMQKPRAAHTATVVPGAAGRVLVAGGAATLSDANPPEKLAIASLADSSSTELYAPDTGQFTLASPMSVPRFFHTATALADAVALVGGTTDVVGQPTKSADLFTWSAAQPSGTITPTAGTLSFARTGHAAALLPTGDLLVTGGVGSSSFALLSTEVLCHNGGCGGGLDRFTAGGMMSAARAFHTATALPTGDVLVAGGISAVSAPITFQPTAELYSAGAFGAAFALQHARAFHAAVALSPAPLFGGAATQVALVGGFDGVADLIDVEGYQASSGTMAVLPSLGAGRRRAVALQVNAGDSVLAGRGVLVAGGVTGSSTNPTFVNGTATASAEVLVRALGDACASGAECLSGFCADGVCCDRGCSGECEACSAATKQSAMDTGLCGPRLAGTPVGTVCVADVEVHNVCDATGHVTAGAGTHACLGGCGATSCLPVDLAVPPDLSEPSDLAAPADLAAAADLATPPDLAAPDLATAPDLAGPAPDLGPCPPAGGCSLMSSGPRGGVVPSALVLLLAVGVVVARRRRLEV